MSCYVFINVMHIDVDTIDEMKDGVVKKDVFDDKSTIVKRTDQDK